MAPARVLIVEDDPQYSDLLQRALVNAGFHCAVASSADEAWDRLSDSLPDLVLLDQKLPDTSGEALCERIRARPNSARLLVAFLTGDEAFADGAAWLTAGGDTCWIKPTSPFRAVMLVKGLLRRHAWDGQARKLLGPGLFLDRREHLVLFNGRRSKKLTDRELLFIEALAAMGSSLLTRQAALDVVFKDDPPTSPEPALSEMLHKLRLKLPRALARAIETVFGKGFRLRLPGPDGDTISSPPITSVSTLNSDFAICRSQSHT